MAKSKHKRSVSRALHKQLFAAAPAQDPRQQGWWAFQAGRFDEAVAAWSRLAQSDERVAAALAEAHFRRALARPAGDGQLADLRRAVELAPAELRYQYHLGLALHRAGELPAAVQCYRAILARDPAWPGAGLALALAALEQDSRADLAALPGSTPAVRDALAPVQALLRGDGNVAPQGDGPLARLWRGLGLIAAGDGAAREALADDRPLPSKQAAAVRRYYQGVAAAQAGDLDAALQDWRRASAEGLDRPWLRENLVAGTLRTLDESADLARATATAERALALGAGRDVLGEAVVRTLDRAAHAAAAADAWARAATLWEEARQVVSAGTALGSPRPLLHNLALAYEAQERWVEAAEAWRAMLRTRPRKRAEEGGAESGPSEAQWAWVRTRVIECYKNAGRPGEAVAVFRQAIKAAPADLDLRLQLADALLANEQDQAAYNELLRILQVDPHHADARLRLATLQSERGEWYAAERTLRVVLAQQPEREDVRRQVAQLLLKRGEQLHGVQRFPAAIQAFEEGRQLAPDDYRFPLNLARVSFDQRKVKQARDWLERALELGADRPDAWAQVIEAWAVADKLDEVRAVLARAEATLPPTPQFYVALGVLLLTRKAQPALSMPNLFSSPTPLPRPVDNAWSQLALELLDRAMALRPDDVEVPTQTAAMLLSLRPDLALRYAEAAARLAPDDPETLRLLGLALGLNDRQREAKETLRRAARLARLSGNSALAQEIDDLRRDIDNPMLGYLLRMGPLLGDLDLDDVW